MDDHKINVQTVLFCFWTAPFLAEFAKTCWDEAEGAREEFQEVWVAKQVAAGMGRGPALAKFQSKSPAGLRGHIGGVIPNRIELARRMMVVLLRYMGTVDVSSGKALFTLEVAKTYMLQVRLAINNGLSGKPT